MSTYNNDFTEEKKIINDALTKRKLYNNGTPAKTKDEKLVTQHHKATGTDEPADRLTLDAQVKVVRTRVLIDGISQLLKVPVDTASKISIDEIELDNIDTYHELLHIIDAVFDDKFLDYTEKQLTTTVDVLKSIGANVPIELVYALQLHRKFKKGTKSKNKKTAIENLLKQCFPGMKDKNIQAIISNR